MIRPDQIPDAVVEAAAKAIGEETYVGNKHTLREAAVAAIAAALNAWPDHTGEWNVLDNRMWVTLPLPEAERIAKQEKSDND